MSLIVTQKILEIEKSSISFYQYNDTTLLIRKFANNHDCAQTYFLQSFFLHSNFFSLQDNMKNQLKVDFTVGSCEFLGCVFSPL